VTGPFPDVPPAFEIYQPGKVTLSVQLGLPLFASESKFCEYIPPLIKTWADTGRAGKTAAARAINNILVKNSRTVYRF
jgi:hypothetical protein